jgi:aminopeptidase N
VEGLTVCRDQEFTADLHARSSKRIEDVNALRTLQFAEDAGPMAHPVRPEHYIEMNNFYTLTVYEKGAEVIRMIHTFLGEVGFQKGMALYFERFDGQAVTIDDFVGAMSDANDFDFTQFKHWYSESGTPEISISTHYDKDKKTYTATVNQEGIGSDFMFSKVKLWVLSFRVKTPLCNSSPEVLNKANASGKKYANPCLTVAV